MHGRTIGRDAPATRRQPGEEKAETPEKPPQDTRTTRPPEAKSRGGLGRVANGQAHAAGDFSSRARGEDIASSCRRPDYNRCATVPEFRRLPLRRQRIRSGRRVSRRATMAGPRRRRELLLYVTSYDTNEPAPRQPRGPAGCDHVVDTSMKQPAEHALPQGTAHYVIDIGGTPFFNDPATRNR